VSLGQLKVMSAIESCRTAALLRIREKPMRVFEEFRAKSVGGRSIRKRLARSSSIGPAPIVASITLKRQLILASDKHSRTLNKTIFRPGRDAG
jgi:hypothetical protein